MKSFSIKALILVSNFLWGIREGDSENWELCRDLFNNLISRGLDQGKTYLFVIDGAKALKKSY